MEKYRILQTIGRGNFGVVHLVETVHDGRKYVMKQISMKDSSADERESALQEAKLLASLKHSFIVGHIESFEENDVLHCVMHVCEGGDLCTAIKKRNGELFEENQILDWFVQLAMALDYLHRTKIIHRDIKTQNVFLTRRGWIRLGDFGIARVLSGTHELAHTSVGTPYSMSPEVVVNQPYSYGSDVWALGAVLYEMCTLRHAFDANNLLGLAWKIMEAQPEPIPSCYSPELSQLINLMLTKDPEHRPSVEEILAIDWVHQRATEVSARYEKYRKEKEMRNAREEKRKTSGSLKDSRTKIPMMTEQEMNKEMNGNANGNGNARNANGLGSGEKPNLERIHSPPSTASGSSSGRHPRAGRRSGSIVNPPTQAAQQAPGSASVASSAVSASSSAAVVSSAVNANGDWEEELVLMSVRGERHDRNPRIPATSSPSSSTAAVVKMPQQGGPPRTPPSPQNRHSPLTPSRLPAFQPALASPSPVPSNFNSATVSARAQMQARKLQESDRRAEMVSRAIGGIQSERQIAKRRQQQEFNGHNALAAGMNLPLRDTRTSIPSPSSQSHSAYPQQLQQPQPRTQRNHSISESASSAGPTSSRNASNRPNSGQKGGRRSIEPHSANEDIMNDHHLSNHTQLHVSTSASLLHSNSTSSPSAWLSPGAAAATAQHAAANSLSTLSSAYPSTSSSVYYTSSPSSSSSSASSSSLPTASMVPPRRHRSAGTIRTSIGQLSDLLPQDNGGRYSPSISGTSSAITSSASASALLSGDERPIKSTGVYLPFKSRIAVQSRSEEIDGDSGIQLYDSRLDDEDEEKEYFIAGSSTPYAVKNVHSPAASSSNSNSASGRDMRLTDVNDDDDQAYADDFEMPSDDDETPTRDHQAQVEYTIKGKAPASQTVPHSNGSNGHAGGAIQQPMRKPTVPSTRNVFQHSSSASSSPSPSEFSSGTLSERERRVKASALRQMTVEEFDAMRGFIKEHHRNGLPPLTKSDLMKKFGKVNGDAIFLIEQYVYLEMEEMEKKKDSLANGLPPAQKDGWTRKSNFSSRKQ